MNCSIAVVPAAFGDSVEFCASTVAAKAVAPSAAAAAIPTSFMLMFLSLKYPGAQRGPGHLRLIRRRVGPLLVSMLHAFQPRLNTGTATVLASPSQSPTAGPAHSARRSER